MGPLATRMHQVLADQLQAQHIELADESHMHSGTKAETHFNLVIVSPAFDGLRLVRRHRLVYAAVQAELRDGVHALTMKTLTPTEWQAANGPIANVSPACLGGSKAEG